MGAYLHPKVCHVPGSSSRSDIPDKFSNVSVASLALGDSKYSSVWWMNARWCASVFITILPAGFHCAMPASPAVPNAKVTVLVSGVGAGDTPAATLNTDYGDEDFKYQGTHSSRFLSMKKGVLQQLLRFYSGQCVSNQGPGGVPQCN